MSDTPKPGKRGKTGGRATTIKDIARSAGVSIATVSRAMNNPELLSRKTRERLEHILQTTDYVPNLLAGSLPSQRSKLIFILVPGILSPIFNETVVRIIKEFEREGLLGVMGLAAEKPADMNRTITSVLGRRPDAIILTSTQSDPLIRKRLRAADVTVIETWDLPKRPIDIAIGFSQEAVGAAIAELVASKGRRSALIITTNTDRALARLKGFVETFRSLGLPEPVCDVSPEEYGMSNVRQRLARQLDASVAPDVVICNSDLIGQDVLTEASARGLKVPQDLSVVGFGGTLLSAHTDPPLTTVRIDSTAIAEQAVEILALRAKGLEPPRKRIDVGFELIVREST